MPLDPQIMSRRLRAHAGTIDRPRAEVLPVDVSEDGTAKLRLYDPIDSWGEDWGVSAKEFASTLDALPEGVQNIELHLNSPGGDVFDGIAIMNALRSHPANVTAVVDGIAASAASFIAASADRLVMAPNSELMIHDAWGLAIGNAADMAQMGELLDHLSNNIASVYAQKSGGDTADWRAAMQRESWFSAQEAVDAGLADRIDGGDTAKNHFDLSIFTYAGRNSAPAPLVEAVASPPTDPPASETENAPRSTNTQELSRATIARQHAMTKETF